MRCRTAERDQTHQQEDERYRGPGSMVVPDRSPSPHVNNVGLPTPLRRSTVSVVPSRIIVTRHTNRRLVGMEDEHATITPTGATWRNPIAGRDEHLPAGHFRIEGDRR